MMDCDIPWMGLSWYYPNDGTKHCKTHSKKVLTQGIGDESL